MKIPALLFVATFLGAAPLAEQGLSQHDRDRVMSELHASRKMFLDSLAGVSHEQWVFKAGPDRWSIQEVAEHIATAEPFIRGNIQKQIMGSQANPELAAKRAPQNDAMNELVVKGLNDRTHKVEAPEPLKPKDLYAAPSDAITAFNRERDITLEYVRTTSDNLREHFQKGPTGGDLDAVQWLLLLAGHTERHVAQLLEVKRSPTYPTL